MDNVLKQRLIGASILIALAVIFVPMLFDGPETDPVSRELDIELPSAPGDRAPIRRLPLDPDQTRATAQAEPGGESDSPVEAIQPPRLRSTTRPAASANPGSGSRREGDLARSANESARSSPGADSGASAAEPEPDRDPTPTPSGPAEEPWEPPAMPSDPETSDSSAQEATDRESEAVAGFEVQVASFGNRDNADALVERLTRLGHVATIDLLVRGSSELHRVRTGPYRDRADAERALGQISQTVQGVSPVIVASSAVAAPATSADTGFAVQVGSFASRNNAVRLLDQLGNQGYDAFIHEDQAGSRRIWRVRVGPLGTRPEAAERLARLVEELGIDGLVVSHP